LKLRQSGAATSIERIYLQYLPQNTVVLLLDVWIGLQLRGLAIAAAFAS